MLRINRKTHTEQEAHLPTSAPNRHILDKLPMTCETAKQRKSIRRNTHLNYKGDKLVEKGGSARLSDKKREKENMAVNQNTLKLEQLGDEEGSGSGLDQLSQIRFISKECSSIKENNNDYQSDTISGNHLDDFSPLFQNINTATKDDFMLEIQDIQEIDIFSAKPSLPRIQKNRALFNSREHATLSWKNKDINQSKKYFELFPEVINFPADSNQFDRTKRVMNTLRCGKIRKNRNESISKLTPEPAVSTETWIEQKIIDIFDSLNANNEQYLKQGNCNCENVSTELNYLIGSILTKIKVKDKKYNIEEFSKEFKELIRDSQPEELEDIMKKNGLRKRQIGNKETFPKISKLVDCQNISLKDISFQTSPNFNKNVLIERKNVVFSDNISRINSKLDSYLSKHKIGCDNLISSEQKLSQLVSEPAHYNPGVRRNSTLLKGNMNIQEESSDLQLTLSESQISLSDKIAFSGNKVGTVSGVSITESIKIDFSLKHDRQIIKGVQGEQFSLIFTELNKHLS